MGTAMSWDEYLEKCAGERAEIVRAWDEEDSIEDVAIRLRSRLENIRTRVRGIRKGGVALAPKRVTRDSERVEGESVGPGVSRALVVLRCMTCDLQPHYDLAGTLYMLRPLPWLEDVQVHADEFHGGRCKYQCDCGKVWSVEDAISHVTPYRCEDRDRRIGPALAPGEVMP